MVESRPCPPSQRRVALVSGVARPPGLGRATALRLARAGLSIAGADFVADEPQHTGEVRADTFDAVIAEVQEVARANGGEVLAFPLESGSVASWSELIAATIGRFQRLDICCALNGTTGPEAGDGRLIDVSAESWARCIELNLTATWALVTAAARAMIDTGRPGAIAVLSSQAALVAKDGVGAVGAARAGVNHLVSVLAKELGPDGIRVNAVAPLAVAPSEQFPNPGLLALAEQSGEPFADWIGRRIPLGRAQDADETAAVIEFLCSPAASYVSGVTVPVHGGAQP